MACKRAPILALLLTLAPRAVPSSADLPRPIFYLPLDGTTRAALAGGSPSPRVAGQEDTILSLLNLRQSRLSPGKVSQCCDLGDAPLVFSSAGSFYADEGACSFWVSPRFRGDDRALYATLFGAADWGMVYKYQDQTSLTFATAKPERDLYYDCGFGDISAWRPGEWHHVVVCWSRQENARRIYVDGKPGGRGSFPFHREVRDGPLFIGAGCTLYLGHTAHARMDEVAIWDRPLDDQAVRMLYDLGMAGKPLWQVDAAAGAIAW